MHWKINNHRRNTTMENSWNIKIPGYEKCKEFGIFKQPIIPFAQPQTFSLWSRLFIQNRYHFFHFEQVGQPKTTKGIDYTKCVSFIYIYCGNKTQITIFKYRKTTPNNIRCITVIWFHWSRLQAVGGVDHTN